jgi:hypothetical protein
MKSSVRNYNSARGAMTPIPFRARSGGAARALEMPWHWATKRVASQVRTRGVQAFLRWVRERCAHRWLRREWIEHFRATPLQLRLE